jgi:hypothetical protein
MTCTQCAEPRFKGSLCHEHHKQWDAERKREAYHEAKTKDCPCGRAKIAEDKDACRRCNNAKSAQAYWASVRANPPATKAEPRPGVKRCACGAAIGPTSVKCRQCNLNTINRVGITSTPPPLVFAGLREDLAADEALYCPERAKVVDAVRRRV